MNQFKHRVIQLGDGDINIHLVEAGESGKQSLILCHGFPETWYSWRHQIKSFAEAGYHVIAPDMRGFGESSSPESVEAFALTDMVGDLVGIAASLQLQKPIVVGHDWGATVAWHAALWRPDIFKAVASLSVPMMGQPPVAPSQLFPQNEDAMFYVLYFQQPGIAETELEKDVPTSLAKIYYALAAEASPGQSHGDKKPYPFMMVSRTKGLLAALDTPPAIPWLSGRDLQTYAEAFARSGFRGGLNYYRNMDRNWRMMKAFAGIKVELPALFLVGDNDMTRGMPGMSKIIDSMPDLVPQLRATKIIEHCGHWMQQEQPQKVTQELLSFFASV